MKLRLVCKVKSQLCAWMTSAAVCVEGFGRLRKSAAVCVEACSCVHGFEDLKGSAAECADQNCGFCKELNKTQFCGRNP